MFLFRCIPGLLLVAVLARADEAPVPVVPPGASCAIGFAQISTYQRIGNRPDRGPIGDLLRKAIRRTPHSWTADEYDKLSQVKVTDLFPVDTRPGGLLSINPRGLEEFNKFLQDYREALYNRLEQLDAADGGRYLGKDRLSDFRQWLRAEARQGKPPLADFNPDITALLKEYKAKGQDMTLEQLADWLFVRKFLPARFNSSPADVFQYLRELPPTMSGFLIERAQNVVRTAGKTLGTTVKNGLTYGLVTVVASAVIAKVANAPIQNVVDVAIDTAADKVKHIVNDPLGAQDANANDALVRSLDAMKILNMSANSDDRAAFEGMQQTVRENLHTVFTALKNDLNKKAATASFESKLEDQIKAGQAQLIPTHEALDESMLKIKNQTAALAKLKAPMNPLLKATTTRITDVVDPSALTVDGLTKSIAAEQAKARTLETQLASIMADWLLDRYLHNPTDPKYPDSKDSVFPEATKVAYKTLFQDFMSNDKGLHISALNVELLSRLKEVANLTKDSSFLDKDKVNKAVGNWP